MSSCTNADPGHALGVMWKTVSETCNLACEYCYYSRDKGSGGIPHVEEGLLEKFIKEYMENSKGIATFAWQGGEPLLAGIEFFKKVVTLQAKYAPKNTMISNSIQTNGTLITREWALFFKKFNFLVGVSLDGPEEINDKKRVTRSGEGSFQSTMRGIQQLKDAKVEFNILTVIHHENVGSVQEILAFFQKEEFRYIQFIPCMDFESQEPSQPGLYAITPEQYGGFLCEVFDIWYNGGNPCFSDRFFDHMLTVYLHKESQVCTFQKECPTTLILEKSGDAYPCDFFIHEDYKFGNAAVDAVEELQHRLKSNAFRELKPELPDSCKSCDFLHLCRGGCPRNRNWDVGHSWQADYFCSSYRQAFLYADERMKKAAEKVKKRRIVEYTLGGSPLPGRNDVCVCGSGRKFKKCCEPLTARM